MGREIRKVPADWVHPKAGHYERVGEEMKWVEHPAYQPMHDQDYESAAQQWIAEFDQWRAGSHPQQDPDYAYFWEYDAPPKSEYYRSRKWSEEEATHYQIYETVSEGTPVSPVFATLDDLIAWCVAQGYSPYAAARFAQSGWVPSAIIDTSRGIIARDIEAAGLE